MFQFVKSHATDGMVLEHFIKSTRNSGVTDFIKSGNSGLIPITVTVGYNPINSQRIWIDTNEAKKLIQENKNPNIAYNTPDEFDIEADITVGDDMYWDKVLSQVDDEDDCACYEYKENNPYQEYITQVNNPTLSEKEFYAIYKIHNCEWIWDEIFGWRKNPDYSF